MTTYANGYDTVEILEHNETDYFLRVRMPVHVAYLHNIERNPYWVLADTLRYRMDDQPHPLDVRELKVLSTEMIEGSDEAVSVTLEVKG
ncbi:hypothetical protein [Rhizobium leguminosarum]|uniref:hypothetical protein n=1 Tax=Rhizobium leguminosarum TaxID=384 RepID=UPI0015FB2F26|nr:hypothetical protein [Rhizobium leguminosarum]MBA9034339.1 hypothetical protein [Rhizobium leguminosarum]